MLEAQIRDLRRTIEPFKESEEFLRLSTELKNRLIKWDTETQNKKNKKFIRDLDDFGKNNVFKWQVTTPDVASTQIHLNPSNVDMANTPLTVRGNMRCMSMTIPTILSWESLRMVSNFRKPLAKG